MAAAVTLILALVFFRLAAVFSGTGWMKEMANFSPMAAIVLCAAVFFPKKWSIAIPLCAILISDVALNLYYGMAPFTLNTVSILLGFGFVFWIGSTLRNRGKGRNLPHLIGGSIAGALIFYTITNSASWLINSTGAYAHSFGGWVQCMTVGMPGPPPTYVFLRNSLAGDLVFTAVFWAILVFSERKQAQAIAGKLRGNATGTDPVRPL